MYVLKVLIITDEDFGFNDPILQVEPDEEKIFVFNTRKEATSALLNHVKCVVDTLRVYDREYIKTWYKNFYLALQLLVKKIDTFSFGQIFGNQEVHYTLMKCETKTMQNGISYVQKNIECDFDAEGLRLEDLNWDYIKSLKDVE